MEGVLPAVGEKRSELGIINEKGHAMLCYEYNPQLCNDSKETFEQSTGLWLLNAHSRCCRFNDSTIRVALNQGKRVKNIGG